MKNKYILLLLFAVVVLFSLLGSFSEGFDDMPVPLCKDKECSGDDYILKSQVVPPVCPACPGFLGTDDSDEKGSPIDDTSTKDNIVSEKVIEKEKEKQIKIKSPNSTSNKPSKRLRIPFQICLKKRMMMAKVYSKVE